MTNRNSTPTQTQSPEEDRVQTAITEKGSLILENLQNYQLDSTDLNILFVAYKELDRLDLFAKSTSQENYRLIQQYPICARSGKLGPKKAEGDKQVPEGFYTINRFNPKSKFYLSLGLNYPNAFELAHNYTGSDIFIHGKCETVGCLPMTDDLMKEIYLYALWAKDSGQQNIPVYIFPFEMTEENMLIYKPQVDDDTFSFWQNIQQGYLLFQESNKEVTFEVIDRKYQFTY
ncbi:L,D-transpeptidase family protein [Sphingobacterium litopenaei]|uniref:L,D-transpeptidase family protein n=1 Tax=Sphingobacterium litopenaei TaxID=2763500 RepID=A0ABR7YGM6_9SPHI|nr:L,D-transpeptidase family protein [Sphingobacterium litopenaei]MBD1430464.1 L,D-transpeptidase family protein [Sphingobacterium litopenaei]